MENIKVREYLEKGFEKFDARTYTRALWRVEDGLSVEEEIQPEMEYASKAYEMDEDVKKVKSELRWACEKYDREIYRTDNRGNEYHITFEGQTVVQV